MYNASVSQPFQPSSIALFLLVVGCSSAQVSTTTDGSTDRPAADVPASPWQVEFGDGVTTLRAIWGSGPNDIYAVGDNGTEGIILHSVGDGKWLTHATGVGDAFFSVWGSGADDIYVGGSGNTLLHSTGDGTWALQTIPQLGPVSIWGSSASDVYLAGLDSMGNVYHSTGNGTWSAQNIGSASSTISAVWGTSATNVYFAGGDGTGDDIPYVLHGPGAPTVETTPPPPDMEIRTIFQLWGSGPNDIYAVGYSNQILHSVGAGVWTLQTSPQGAAMGGLFEGVWGSGPNDIYVVGDETGVAHSSGDGVWTIDPDLHNQPLAIWGSGPNDVYVVGTTVAHKKL